MIRPAIGEAANDQPPRSRPLVQRRGVDLRELGGVVVEERHVGERDPVAVLAGFGVEMLVRDAALLDRQQQQVARLPVDALIVDDRPALALDDVDHEPALMAVLARLVDERVREHLITREISIGNYVLSGGELAACVLCDSIIRLIPGVLNDETSALFDSFQDNLISPPVYTRPADYKGWKVPDILLSGNQKKIDEWRMEKSIERTKLKRPELHKKFF